jgi:hypothetical protein
MANDQALRPVADLLLGKSPFGLIMLRYADGYFDGVTFGRLRIEKRRSEFRRSTDCA